ncbi:MAG: hypothetical protein SFW07_04655 [Gammaproteobacteria bacterium]|nr:hypothetical protein [Gammaproteobacteria bacterium]
MNEAQNNEAAALVQWAEYRTTFLGRLTWPSSPQTFAEGFVKGLAVGAVITSVLLTHNIINFNPTTAKSVMTFYSGLVLTMAGIGLKNQIKPAARRAGFFEHALSPLPPQTSNEGAIKGIGAGFLAFILLFLARMTNFSNIPLLLTICSGLAALGTAWGRSNEMRRP